MDAAPAALATFPVAPKMAMAKAVRAAYRPAHQVSEVADRVVADQAVAVSAEAAVVLVVVEAAADQAEVLAVRAALAATGPDNRLAGAIALILAPLAIAGIVVNKASMAW